MSTVIHTSSQKQFLLMDYKLYIAYLPLTPFFLRSSFVFQKTFIFVLDSPSVIKQEQPCSAGFGTAQGLAGQMEFTDQKRKHIA